MSARSNPLNRNNPDLIRRPVLITACVAGLAAVTLAGCTHSGQANNRFGRSASAHHYDPAHLSVAPYVSPSDVSGQYDRTWYEVRAQQAGLPARWLSEAVSNDAQVNARRAAAVAAAVNAESDTNEKLAFAGARLAQGYAQERTSQAEANRLRGLYDARLDEMSAHAAASEEAIEAEALRNDAFLLSTQKERRAQVGKMRSEASAAFERAQAEYERMLAERRAVERRGVAELNEMAKIADMVEARTVSKAAALRAQSEAVSSQYKAEVQDLSQRARTLTERVAARTAELRQQASSLDEQSQARAADLFAQADAIEASVVGAGHASSLTAAESAYQSALSEAFEIRTAADTMLQDMEAEVERRAAEATRVFETAQVDHDQREARITSRNEEAMAEVYALRAKAEELETQARARFVNAQSSARAEAIRRDSQLLEAITEAQRDKLRAEAEAEAMRIRAEVATTVARQIQQGQVSIQDLFNDRGQPVAQDLPAPELPVVPATGAPVDPGHVAAFKTALAEVTLMRAKADAQARGVGADFDEELGSLNAWRIERTAENDRMIADIEAFQQGVYARVNELRQQAESTVRLAEVRLGRDQVEAESSRKEAFAKIARLRAEGKAYREKAAAQATRLLAEAEANDRAGAAEMRALEVRIQSAQRRGEAEVRGLRAEADSLTRSQNALVAQMRQEIKSTQQILTAELARLDQGATSFIEMAEATYNEGVTIADAYGVRTEAMLESLRAQHDADRRIAQADVAHMRNVIDAGELLAQANVERWGADARAQRTLADARGAAERATIIASADAFQSRVLAELAKADAQDEAVRSFFEARLASHQSDLGRNAANSFLAASEHQARTEQALAAAAAYSDMSSAAMQILQEKSANFERAARLNWDLRLAMPVNTNAPAFNANEGFDDSFFSKTRVVRVGDDD